jgi:hypothetical protein
VLPIRLLTAALGALVVFGVSAASPTWGPAAPQIRNGGENDVLAALGPQLRYVGGGARIYYDFHCPIDHDRGQIVLPLVVLHAPSPGTMGLSAIRDIFQGDAGVTVTRDRSGMIRIWIGDAWTAVPQTRIRNLDLDQRARYYPWDAIAALQGAREFRSEVTRLRLKGPPMQLLDVAEAVPVDTAPNLPHLPLSVTGVTADQALDLIARTFQGVVVYAACRGSSPLFFINFEGTRF